MTMHAGSAVTVTYPKGSNPAAPDLELKMVFTSIHADPEQACEEIWGLLQRHDEASDGVMAEIARDYHVPGIRSAMVGDLFAVNSPPPPMSVGVGSQKRFFVVEGVGFHEITAEQAAKWETLDPRDRSMGVNGYERMKGKL